MMSENSGTIFHARDLDITGIWNVPSICSYSLGNWLFYKEPTSFTRDKSDSIHKYCKRIVEFFLVSLNYSH